VDRHNRFDADPDLIFRSRNGSFSKFHNNWKIRRRKIYSQQCQLTLFYLSRQYRRF
jgi:hypothetical protein